MTDFRALTIAGLTVAAFGLVGQDLRLCCAVPRPYTVGDRASVVVSLGAACYMVGLCCTGYAADQGVAEFSVDLPGAAPLGYFFGLNPWRLGSSAPPRLGISERRARYSNLSRRQRRPSPRGRRPRKGRG